MVERTTRLVLIGGAHIMVAGGNNAKQRIFALYTSRSIRSLIMQTGGGDLCCGSVVLRGLEEEGRRCFFRFRFKIEKLVRGYHLKGVLCTFWVSLYLITKHHHILNETLRSQFRICHSRCKRMVVD